MQAMSTPDVPEIDENRIDWQRVSRILLQIVADLDETEYDKSTFDQHQQQVAELELNDLPDPASDKRTSQG